MKPTTFLPVGLLCIWPIAFNGNFQCLEIPNQTPEVQLADEEQIIFDLTNGERIDDGLSELEINEYLCEVARSHSRNMAEGSVSFGHDGFDERVDMVWGKIGAGQIGENCALNWNGGEMAVTQWMNSSGHRENILTEEYTLIGVGVAQSEDGAYYCTQIFLVK